MLLPKFSRDGIENTEKKKAFLREWLGWSAWLIIPIFLFDLFGRPLFIFINGIQYENSFGIFVIFSLGIWLSMMFSPLVNILIASDRYKFLYALSVLALITDLLLNLLLVPSFGGYGAAVAIIVSIGVINVCSFMKIQRLEK